MIEANILTAIPSALHQPVQQYAQTVRDIYGEKARALTLHGLMNSDDFNLRPRLLRSVLTLSEIDLATLRKLSEYGPRLGKLHIASPLIITPQHILTSLDTFPLELLDIQQTRLHVFGEDFFSNLTFHDAHVRLQCERELKTMLIGMRQGLLASTGSERFLDTLQVDIGESLLRTLRGVLWLNGFQEACPATRMIDEVEKRITRSLPGLRTAIKTSRRHGWNEFLQLYEDIQALSDWINAH